MVRLGSVLSIAAAIGFGCAAPPGSSGDDAGAGAIDSGADAQPDAGSLIDAGADSGAAGPDAGLPDAGAADAGAGLDAGSPIGAAAETWTWVDFPDSQCGNGAATGLGVNLTSRSSDVFLFLMGGGGCWDYQTCYVAKLASNIGTGYTAAEFASEPVLSAPPFNRGDANNPFKDASFVFVPYCTGDIHSGDSIGSYDSSQPSRKVFHKGAPNLDAFLRRLVPTFPGPRRVFLSGSSAGGFASQMQYPRVAAAFSQAEVHSLADSGQMVAVPAGRYPLWISAWNLQMPADCADCGADLPNWVSYLSARYPDRRFGLLAYRSDATLTGYFGYSLFNSDFANAVDSLLASKYDPAANAHYFLLSGRGHVLLLGLDTLATPGGVTLRGWLSQFVSGAPGWSSAR